MVIFTNDHVPAHVHLFGSGQVKINLTGPDGRPELVWAEGMKQSDVRRAMKLVARRQEDFLERWKEIHG
ncbi:DUF4160 domain-containing protein [Fodinicurvata fenggangensis]|uniref:DUF4160 domain-containing protein n=1 Tax=Fodinicurvata fenggangensis TaxID=1121830 RepID=UPI001FE1EEB6|nr:DUF4160 domain-containing protein [Fodinicurvata fenggangensis]